MGTTQDNQAQGMRPALNNKHTLIVSVQITTNNTNLAFHKLLDFMKNTL